MQRRSFAGRLVVFVLVALLAALPWQQPAPASADFMQAISAGYAHACAVTVKGGVQCWGSNSSGQLGNGTTTASSTPVDVTGLTSGVAAVEAGEAHACAVTTAGGLKCWGRGSFGRLGNGSTSDSSTPVDVTELTSGVVTVSAGRYHTCAVTTAGGLKCWGINHLGQLGIDTPPYESTTPVDVIGLASGVATVSAGYEHTCAVTTAGGVKCWGWNDVGQVGNGTYADGIDVPVDVVGLTSGAAVVSAGVLHTCAVTTEGGVKCWGGWPANGTTINTNAPVDVSGLTNGAAVTTGTFHSCALTTVGGVKCWGENQVGQLGTGSAGAASTTPVNVFGLSSGVSGVSAGLNHTCAATTTNRPVCWGIGPLGNGTATQASTPQEVLKPAVGGLAELPDAARAPAAASDASGPGAVALAGIASVAAGVVALAGAAWWARRRQQRGAG